MEREKRYYDHEFLERRLNELDRRSDANSSEKIAAIEKLFQALLLTKSEAMSILISRIQGDNKDCLHRCNSQVAAFYSEIRTLREYNIQRKMQIEVLTKALNDHEVEKEAELEKMHLKIRTLEDWKGSFWTTQIPALVVVTVATIGAAFGGFTWILEYIKKIHGSD